MEKPSKIVALSQDEIDYIASFSPTSPTIPMLGNVTALIRSEIKRINAEYLLDELIKEGIESETLDKWANK
jgi:hypothetical protein